MSITANDGGVLRKLDAIPCNDNGVLHNHDNIKDNNGGVLREIFSAIKLPTSLAWRVDKTWGTAYINNYNTSSIGSTAEDGLIITYTAKSCNTSTQDNLLVTILSNPVFLPVGAKVTVDFQSLSGSGKTYTSGNVELHRNEYVSAGKYDNEPKQFSYSTAAPSGTPTSTTITIEESAEYVFMLNGLSATMGQTSSYYSATIKLSISFSK